MEIRKLKTEDFQSYVELRLEALLNAPNAFLVSYEEEKESGSKFVESILFKGEDENVIFGAFDGSKLVGTAAIFRESRVKARHKAMIWGMFVKPEYRGQQIARRLLSAAIAHGRSRMNAKMVYLGVESSNLAAKKLYETIGFRTWGKEPCALFVDGQYYDEDHMYLPLEAWKPA